MPGTPARTLRALSALLCGCALVAAALAAGGCGAGSAPSRGVKRASATPPSTASTASADPPPVAKAPAGKAVAHPPSRETGKRALVAHVDAVSDRVLAEGKVRIAQGAPSDAEVKREIEAARRHGAKLPAGESVAAFEAAAAQTNEPAPDAVTPIAAWNPRNKPIAAWIVPVLEWAVEHGWRGTVTSGYRTYYEQAQLNAAGLFSAPAGLSNHESTVYPGGAVDVTQPGQLIAVLKGYNAPRRLVGGVLGAVDPEHFSATGD